MAQSESTSTVSYVICLERGSYVVDLDIGKVYRVAVREENDPSDMLRIVDDSGDDYLYPAAWFEAVDLPARARKVLAAVTT